MYSQNSICISNLSFTIDAWLVDSTAHLRAMAAQCIAHLQESDGEAIGFNELLVPENVHHLSLSRPFVLRSHQITAFVAYLAGRIKGTRSPSL